MKFIFLCLSCLQLFALNQCQLPMETELSVKGPYEYPAIVTFRVTLKNGTAIIYGGALLSECGAITLAQTFEHDAEKVEILSGQKDCSSYEQIRPVTDVVKHGTVALAFTDESFKITQSTQPVQINTEYNEEEVGVAVGCAASAGLIYKAKFNYISPETCRNVYPDMNENSECRKCRVIASTCTAPLSNALFIRDKIHSLSAAVEHPGCEMGGSVLFEEINPHSDWIQSTTEERVCKPTN